MLRTLEQSIKEELGNLILVGLQLKCENEALTEKVKQQFAEISELKREKTQVEE